MCGRYWLEGEADGDLAEIISKMQRLDAEKAPRTQGEVFPGDSAPVICLNRSGSPRPYAMRWGYRLEGGKQIINARSETAAVKPLFRDSARLRRCLMPMNAYFEWAKLGNVKEKYKIQPVEGGLHFLAGLYRYEGNSPAFVVLTAPAAPEIEFIHDRMPLILPTAFQESWLRGEMRLPENPKLMYEAL